MCGTYVHKVSTCTRVHAHALGHVHAENHEPDSAAGPAAHTTPMAATHAMLLSTLPSALAMGSHAHVTQWPSNMEGGHDLFVGENGDT